MPVPIPEFNLEGDVITSIEIHWYVFDGASYVEVTQTAAIAAILDEGIIGITAVGECCSGPLFQFFDPESGELSSVIEIDGGWTLPGEGSKPIGSLALQYSIAGNGYRFAFIEE